MPASQGITARRIGATVCMALGSALLIGGGLGFVYGGLILDSSIFVTGLWIFNGSWSPADYCFLGAVLTALGVGLLVGGIMLWRYRIPTLRVHCPGCGYDLRGTIAADGTHCPECGREMVFDEG